MDIIQVVVLAVIQGLTEFWPISSSGHLILTPHFFGWEDQGLAFDVAVHVGTLTAVLAYFRREVRSMATAWWGSVNGRGSSRDSRLAWAVLLGTIPAGLAGLLFNDYIAANFRAPLLVAGTLGGFGIALFLADYFRSDKRDEYSLRGRDVLVIGMAQALALVPGTSRSGVTMTAGLLLGLTRHGAARFSFLLSIPVMVAAGALEFLHTLENPGNVNFLHMGLGLVVSALTGYACIHVFLGMLEKIGMLPFVVYRCVLAVVIVYVFI